MTPRRWISVLGAAALAGAVALAPPAQAGKLNFTQQVQQGQNWCWVATGLSIAQFFGKGRGTSQNDFCLAGRGGGGGGGRCPDQTGQMSNVQRGLQSVGVNPGRAGGPLSAQAITAEINGGRPIETGIYWTQGGGHAQVIYGIEGDTVFYGDPWGQSPRYSQMRVGSYHHNQEFRWAESISGIGR